MSNKFYDHSDHVEDNNNAEDSRGILDAPRKSILSGRLEDDDNGQDRQEAVNEDDIVYTMGDLTRDHGASAVQKAKGIVDRFASADTKMLLRGELGNDVRTVARVLRFAAEARGKEAKLRSEMTSGFYRQTPRLLQEKTKQIEAELAEAFNRMVNIECRQDFIRRNGYLKG